MHIDCLGRESDRQMKNRDIRFSIVVVCLNSGTDLYDTLESINKQTYNDYEVILKDGLSTDGSVTFVRNNGILNGKITIVEKKDAGIYDAMNQALSYVSGDYVFFLNCGDLFYDESVLNKVAEAISTREIIENRPACFYGDIFDSLRKTRISSNPRLDGFALYRNVPCHQVCFYDRVLFEKRAYNTKYSVRADYEHFLYSVYRANAVTEYMDVIIAAYKGGGFSETTENLKRSTKEHAEITAMYMDKKQIRKYKFILGITLAPLRTRLAESKNFSKLYQKIKGRIYRKG